MTSIVLSSVEVIIFLILSGIHFNWVFGGEFGFDKSLPTKEDGTRMLNPKKIDSAIVGFGLLLFAIYYMLEGGFIHLDLPNWITNYLGWIIPSIFIVRAVGDFKYVGFLKKVKNTVFGKFDSKYFSPLCLLIGVIGIIIKIV